MKRDTLDMRYYNTYYYANIVNNIVRDAAEYIRTIHDLFENDGELQFCSPFPKFTALHRFAAFCIELEFMEDLTTDNLSTALKSRDIRLPINYAMDALGIIHDRFVDWFTFQGKRIQEAEEDDLDNYLCELKLGQEYDDFISQITDEVFFIMFLNREMLFSLNGLIAGYIEVLEPDNFDSEVQSIFNRGGMLKRQHIPQWARRAVFFRDRGKCVYCTKDLSGLISLRNANNFDHIIPLARGGINDVTNLQLLCDDCNLKKGKEDLGTSTMYERWYERKD